MGSVRSSRSAVVCILALQAALIILFAIFTRYHPDADATTPTEKVNTEKFNNMYPMFQDVHVMIFAGFGFLMTFLKKYGFSSVGLTMLTAAIIIQWALLCFGFFRMDNSYIEIDIESLLNADVIAAAVLISFGALLGKTSPLQLIIMGVLETVFFCVNEYIGTHIFQAIDAGGSMFVHVFGAYFGLSVSWILARGVKFTKKDEELEKSSYVSDLTAMIGTVFLWLFWPSFNGALVEGDDRHRAIINTYLSLAASCVVTFCLSALLDKHIKFEMVHIQNATLAGGVCVGTAANLMLHPYGALLVGAFAGALSTLGFRFIQGFLLKTIRLHDTCGVHNLHGMPGVAAGLIGALLAAIAGEDTYGTSLYETFKAMTPQNNTMMYQNLLQKVTVDPGLGRTAGLQAGYQLLALFVSFLMAVVGGVVTAYAMKGISPVPVGAYHDDNYLWSLPYDDDPTAANLLVETVVNGPSSQPPITEENIHKSDT